jgi:hypothetical protein
MSQTPGQRGGQWITNLKSVIALWAALGLSITYGTSDTVRGWVHNSPLTIEEVTPEIEPVNYDRIIKELIEQNKGQNTRMDGMQKQINKNMRWHE